MLAVITGVAFLVLGLWGIIGWWPDFISFLKGSVPAMIFVGGFLAVIAGITSIKDSFESKAELTEEEKK
ncbi:MAG: hypothetical protein ABII64_09785 [Elusimicrobiota bacterium]